MKPIYLPLSELVQHPNNPREITDEAMEGLKQSLVDLPELTEANPLIVSNRTGKYVVLGGNQRVEAAKQNGWVEIPCNVMEGLTEAKENEIIIKLNTHYGEWDINKLGTWAVEDLSAWGVPEDVLLNWTESVERADWNGIDSESEARHPDNSVTAKEDDFEQPEPETIKTDIQLGDLITFEKDGVELHRLLCGDSTDAATVERLMGAEKAILMVTDPPYGVNYDPNWRNEINPQTVNGGKLQNDHKTDWGKVYELFQPQVVYTWHAPSKTIEFGNSLRENGYILFYLIVWNKDLQVFGRGDYHWKHEVCWYAVKKGQTHNWQGSRTENTVWDIPTIHSFANGHNKEDWGLQGHSTQKPIECMARPIRNNSSDGQLIADPFLGSGSTMVAAHQLNRRCFGLELEPKYNQIIAQRMHKLDPSLVIKRNGEPMTLTNLTN